MAINRNPNQAKRSPQYIQNASYDEDFNVLAVEMLVYDSSSGTLKRLTTDTLGAYKANDIEEASSTLTYVGKEDSAGNWLVVKIDESSGTSVQYATESNNSGIYDYSTAWSGRASLTYQDYSEAF